MSFDVGAPLQGTPTWEVGPGGRRVCQAVRCRSIQTAQRPPGKLGPAVLSRQAVILDLATLTGWARLARSVRLTVIL